MYNKEEYEKLKREIALDRSANKSTEALGEVSSATNQVSTPKMEVEILYTIEVSDMGLYDIIFYKK